MLILTLWICGCGQSVVNKRGDTFPPAVKAALEQGTFFELLSLDPKSQKQGETKGFHGYDVPARLANLTADSRRMIVTGLLRGFAEHDGKMDVCFSPRHGIRVYHEGKKYTLVICFECSTIKVYEQDAEIHTIPIASTTAAVFNKVLSEANVPLSRQ
jgi:hypothetical protein